MQMQVDMQVESASASGLVCGGGGGGGGGGVWHDVRSLLEMYLLETAAPGSEQLRAKRRAARGEEGGGGAERPVRPQKATVRISGLGAVQAAGALDPAARVALALARALPAVAAADVEKVAIVEQLGSAFVTFARQEAATGLAKTHAKVRKTPSCSRS